MISFVFQRCTVKLSYCKFWIYWVGVNTKFTIWQYCIYTHPVNSKFTIWQSDNKQNLQKILIIYMSGRDAKSASLVIHHCMLSLPGHGRWLVTILYQKSIVVLITVCSCHISVVWGRSKINDDSRQEYGVPYFEQESGIISLWHRWNQQCLQMYRYSTSRQAVKVGSYLYTVMVLYSKAISEYL